MPARSPILDRLLADAARSGGPGRTREIRLEPGAIDAIGPWLDEAHPGMLDVVIADAHTWTAAGRRVERVLRATGRPARHLILEPAPGASLTTPAHLFTEDGVIEALRASLAVSGRMNPIAVGSGTVNDIVKVASDQLGRDYQVVPTAASMNGYTSSIAAVLSGGIKRTVSAHQPEAVFADIDVIRRAPAVMNRAGFGDLLSKPFSHADWLLHHFVRGVPYSREAAGLLDAPWGRMLARAAGIGTGDPEATAALSETLLISGFSMAMAGTSAPASGGEHLISHYWDMEQHSRGLPIRALHGTQVGIGTRLSALLFERLLRLDIDAIDPSAAARRRPDPGWIDRIENDHPDLAPEIVGEIKAQLRAKQRHGAELAAELVALRTRWPELRERLGQILLPARAITEALAAAGGAVRASQIGVARDHLVRTLRVCRHIRTRYVALDLLDDLGLLGAWAIDVARETEAEEGAP